MAILTITREYGSSGHLVGQLVAERLGYEFVDKPRLHRDLLARGALWARLGMELDEFKPDLWERHDWRYQAYLALLESVVFDHAQTGKAVIVGRGCNYILRQAPLCLRVLIVAPLELRTQRIMAQEGIGDAKQAERLVQEIDAERAGYLQVNYGEDWKDLTVYDAIFNTGSHSLEQVAQMLVGLLEEEERQACEADRVLLKGLALAARLKARIAGETKLLLPTLQVSYTGQAIELKAVIHRPEEQLRLMEISREVCGDVPVKMDLRPRV
ncbi:MAG: cytidylate kinase-like family protein [Desulfarculus sp.]|nr:cytidylate kinase-like family protein [Desulfarculus sp.]